MSSSVVVVVVVVVFVVVLLTLPFVVAAVVVPSSILLLAFRSFFLLLPRSSGEALEEAKTNGWGVVLSTQEEQNVSFYGRLGFAVAHRETRSGGVDNRLMAKSASGNPITCSEGFLRARQLDPAVVGEAPTVDSIGAVLAAGAAVALATAAAYFSV